MRLDTRLFRATLFVVAVALVAASLPSPAAADHGRRYKGARYQGGPRVVRHMVFAPGSRPSYYSSRGSSAGPAIAGFIGGLVIGNVLAHAASPPPAAWASAPDYDYYDPYCHERYSSLERYDAHLGCARHPAVVRVIEVRSGRCVGEERWQEGRWQDGRGDGGYDSRGGTYDDQDEGRNDWRR